MNKKCPRCGVRTGRRGDQLECINMQCPLYYRRLDGWRVRLVPPP